ncbi:MAG: autotransporter domain-containing protein [Labrys sp. (in: a-proteobacteria)]
MRVIANNAPSVQAALTIIGSQNNVRYGAGSSFGSTSGGGIIISGEENVIIIDQGASLVPIMSAITIRSAVKNATGLPNKVTNSGIVGREGREKTIDVLGVTPSKSVFELINSGLIVNKIVQGKDDTAEALQHNGGLVTVHNKFDALFEYQSPNVPVPLRNYGIIYDDKSDILEENNKQKLKAVYNTIIRNDGVITGTMQLGEGRDLVINSGVINGDIDFGAPGQRLGTLVLRPGWALNGVARSRATSADFGFADLSLSGEGQSEFLVSDVGAYSASGSTSKKFQGFGGFIKEGSSTWTLKGTADANYKAAGQSVPPVWWISGGRLIVDTDSLKWNVTFGGRKRAGDENFDDVPSLPSGFFRGDPYHQPKETGATATLEFNQSTDATYAGSISECTADGQATPNNETCLIPVKGTVVKSGDGALTLTGTNTYSGGTVLAGGTLVIGGDAALGAAGGSLTFSGGTLKTLADIVTARPIMLDAAGGTIDTNGYSLLFSGSVQGSGGFVKQGLGALTLSGSNTFPGHVRVNAGTLSLQNGSAIGDSAAVSVSSGAILDLGTSNETVGSLSLSGGVIAGTGMLTASTYGLSGGTVNADLGAGTLTQSGTGATLLNGTSAASSVAVSGGTLRLGAAERLSNTAALSVTGGAFDLRGFNETVGSLSLSAGFINGTGTLTASTYDLFSGTVNANLGAGTLTQSGTGTTVLNGTSAASSVTVSGGTLQLGAAERLSNAASLSVTGGAFDLQGFNETVGSLAGTGGTVALGSGTLTVGGANIDTAFDGVITGTGGITKGGSGQLTLSGVNMFTGKTDIKAGTLFVASTGSLAASSDVTVRAFATLAGAGVVGSTLVQKDGTLSPAGETSVGTLSFAGNLSLVPGSSTAIDVDPAAADKLAVTGSATLGGTLRLTALGGDYEFYKTYDLLTAGGGLNGSRFDAVDIRNQNDPAFDWMVGYDATRVTLTLDTRKLGPVVGGPGSTLNQRSVAAGIDRATRAQADPTVILPILRLPADQIPAALDQIAGHVHTATAPMASLTDSFFLAAMLDPNLAGRLPGPPLRPLAVTPMALTDEPGARVDARATAGVFEPSLAGRYAVWGAAIGATGSHSGSAPIGEIGQDTTTAGLAAGIDVWFDDTTRIGVAMGGSDISATMDDGLGSLSATAFQLGLSGTTEIGGFTIAGALAYSYLDVETRRSIPVLSLSSVSASYDAHVVSGRVEAAFDAFRMGEARLRPFGSLQAAVTTHGDIIEKTADAGPGGVTIDGDTSLTARSELGLEIAADLELGGVPMSGFLRAAWAHQLAEGDETTARLNGLPRSDFVLIGARQDIDTAHLAAGFDIKPTRNLNIGLRGAADIGANDQTLSGSISLNMRF